MPVTKILPLNPKKSGTQKMPDFLANKVDLYFNDRMKSWKGRHLFKGLAPTQDSVQMMSNDYLSLSNHIEILTKQSEALLSCGNVMLMSAVYIHGESTQKKFEREMAEFMGMKDSVLCQSGWAANVGLIQAIVNEDTPVYLDMFAHMSMWEGVQAASGKPRAFKHNDPHHLEMLIKKNGPGVIAVDSVYSTTGSLAPLKEIADLASKYDCVFIVDESHSLGTHGEHGEGLVADLGLQSKVQFVTASLAKTFAGRAGIIVCNERLSEYLKYNSLPAIFSSALLPHEIIALHATLDVIKTADERREKVRNITNVLRCGLTDMGYNLDISKAQILGLEAGTEENLFRLRDALESRGIHGSVFCAPATPKNRSLYRLTVNCSLTLADIQKVLSVCSEIRDEIGLLDWPSTRRKNRHLREEQRHVVGC